MVSKTEDLPHALGRQDALQSDLREHLSGKRPAVFLDYDGTLTPIVDRPEDAVISGSMREVVSHLAERCPVCVVSGRDRQVVQELTGLDNLVVAGSHGFDIWSPDQGTLEHDASGGGGFEELIEEVRDRLEKEVSPIEGASVEPKKASVAVHYRLVSEGERQKVKDTVEGLLAERPEELKVTPGKMVYEVQPNVEWNKGKAVLHLLGVLDLDREDVVPIYVGDDVTDEDAFGALGDRNPPGVGVFVGRTGDPEVGERDTAAGYALYTIEEVERFLDALAR